MTAMTATTAGARKAGRTARGQQHEPIAGFRDLADWSGTSPAQLIETHLDRIATTRRCYEQDLRELARWMEAPDLPAMAEELIGSGRGPCKRRLIAWISSQRVRNIAANTIRRRIAAATSLVGLAVDLEVIVWQVGRLPLPPAARVRSCRGPSLDVVKRMFMRCQDRSDPKGARDEALLSLLYYHAMRAMEVLSVRAQDVDLCSRPRTLRITAKRGDGRLEIELCAAAAEAIERWLEQRGEEPGPLFSRCCRWGRRVTTKPLSYWGLRGVIRTLGEATGVRCWPHALRHAAISHMATLTGDSPMWGTALSRHRDVRAWALYQDRAVSHVSAAEVLSRGQVVRREGSHADN